MSGIMAMPLAGTLDGTEYQEIVQGGINVRILYTPGGGGGAGYMPLAGGTFSGVVQFTGSGYIEMNNKSILGANKVEIGDGGFGEGFGWLGTWQINDCPDALVSGSGNLQFVYAGTRIATMRTDGSLDVAVGPLTVAGASVAMDASLTVIANLTANQALANATTSKVALNAESVDTHGCFDPVTGKFTPTVAGLYSVTCTVSFVSAGAVASGQRLIAYVYKNGTQYLAVTAATHASPSNNIQVVALVAMNGTTDYLEMYARRDTTASYDVSAGGTLFSAIRLSA